MSCSKYDDYGQSNKDTFNITSIHREATYPIWIYLPDDYYSENLAYDVLYLLDAEWDKEYVAHKVRDISSQTGNKPPIVVGIGFGGDRMDDYSPTKTKNGAGNANEFFLFIKKELIPKIEADYRVSTSRESRCILGHSLAGLCAGYAFTDHPELFGNYIILSPSFWWDDDIVLQYEQENRDKIKLYSNTVFVGVGGTEGPMIVGSRYFYETLQKHYQNTVSNFRIIKGLGHMTSKEKSIDEGLKFYFNNH